MEEGEPPPAVVLAHGRLDAAGDGTLPQAGVQRPAGASFQALPDQLGFDVEAVRVPRTAGARSISGRSRTCFR